MDKAYPNKPAKLQFAFSASRAYRGFPKTGTYDFPFDTSVPLPSELTFTLERGFNPVEVHVHTQLPGITKRNPNGQIKVNFPEQSANTIYELIATAKMTDTYGMIGETQHRVWSHALSGETEARLAEAVLPAAAGLAGVSSNDLMAASQLEKPRREGFVDDSRSRRARLVRLFAMRAAEDKHINVAE